MPNSSEENYHYTILDIRGQEIIRGKKSSSLISVKDLIPGVYIFKLEVGNSISTKKFIKE
jgi:hypothetical protein